jgi:acylphosphatase
MTKKRATIIISGDVQDVGFRGIVMRLAQKSELRGYVENMRDGSVRAICEGEEKAIKAFAKKLDIRNGDVSVENVDVKWSKAQGKFKYFEVKYSDLGAEMFQGFATAGRMLGDVTKEVRIVGQKVDVVGQKVDSMHDDMNTRFDTLDTKYGEFGKDMKFLRGDISDMKLLASEFREFKDLFAIYVKHQLEKDA